VVQAAAWRVGLGPAQRLAASIGAQRRTRTIGSMRRFGTLVAAMMAVVRCSRIRRTGDVNLEIARSKALRHGQG